MFWPLILISSSFAQEPDLSAVKALEEKIPSYNTESFQRTFEDTDKIRRHVPPKKPVKMETILSSGIAYGAINPGASIVKMSDNTSVKVSQPMYLRYYKLEDENRFKYLINKDGTNTFKVYNEYIEPINEELVLYEPPHKYTPVIVKTVKPEYDQKFKVAAEAGLYLGYVKGDYMQDLFNDESARSGISTQYAAHLFTDWNLIIIPGIVTHFEKTTYQLTGGGNLNYSSTSFGPQFKTRDFDFQSYTLRIQSQLRVSPFAQANAETSNGEVNMKFNSTDLLTSVEHPIKNQFGEFVLGAFYQSQWLNLKDQSEIVQIKASNRSNKSFGLFLSQVFN